MTLVLDVLRYAVFGVFVGSAAIALGSWAVRSRRISPFGSAGQTIRRLTDPVLAPIETWQLRRGGNPQNAGWWLFGVSLIGGILVLSVAQLLITTVLGLARAALTGPLAAIRFAIVLAGQIVSFALIARVIGSWLGVGRYQAVMKYAYRLTDWIVEPLKRVIPPLGPIDITPFVAWFVIQIALGVIVSVL